MNAQVRKFFGTHQEGGVLSSIMIPFNLLMRTGFTGEARPGRDADHSPPSTAEVKNE
jgi:hypothetical protein